LLGIFSIKKPSYGLATTGFLVLGGSYLNFACVSCVD
jgi:hypothetical protein